jgi:GABA permease
LFPVLSILTVAGIVSVLVQMAFNQAARTQLWLSLLSWALVILLYVVAKWWYGPAGPETEPQPSGKAKRVLVLANETLSETELFDVLRRLDVQNGTEYFVCVPTSPIDTGQAENSGPVYVRDLTVEAAQRRLDDMLHAMRKIGLPAEGTIGDYRPWHALASAMDSFKPDQLVIADAHSGRSRFDLVHHARSAYPIPVIHIVSGAPAGELAQ